MTNGSNVSSVKKKVSFLIICSLLLINCPRHKKVAPPPVSTEGVYVLHKGQTLEIALNSLISDARLSGSIQTLLKKLDFPFRQCLPGDSLKIQRKNGQFERLTYRQSLTTVYYVFYNGPHLVLAMKQPIIETVNRIIRGRINSTLYETLLDLGETPELVYSIADIFGWEIDFTTETQKGDSFYIVMNKKYCDSTFIGYSDIPIARYRGEIGDFYGIYFCDPDDYFDYYSLKGESLRKALLKSPLKYSYISSYFSKNRYHPILKIWRPHHGLDYSAPAGTPVSSIGDGVVTFKGWNDGYGNMVEIRHKNNFKTRYGHLSSFAKGLTNSKHIKMGELIGYVGSTGLSTGPHLHFELYKDGSPINPTTVKLPRAPSVKNAYLASFGRERDSLLKVIAEKFSPPVVAEKGKGK
jgi:murein DD-endopeptidase MepM/ murein hydrolase activator NlpD